jgi:DNA-directed RNA polymerase subunit RPC12/RpoP
MSDKGLEMGRGAMNRNRYWEVSQSDWYGTAQVLFAFAAVIVISSVLLLPGHWYLWLMIIAGDLALLVAWYAKNFDYLCPGCGEVFEVSTLKNFISPNVMNKKYLKCPRCRKRAWADILKIEEQTVFKK